MGIGTSGMPIQQVGGGSSEWIWGDSPPATRSTKEIIQMIGRRAIIGLSLLCALLFSAIAASGAMAEEEAGNGTTAFTCVPAPEGGAGFSREHCAKADVVASGAKFKHAAIAPGKKTGFDATSAGTAEETKKSTNAVLTATIGGLKATFTAPEVTVTGELENFQATAGVSPMKIKQSKVILHFTKVVLSGALATIEGCKVVEETVVTESLESESVEGPAEPMEASYKPETGTAYAFIHLTGCKTAKLNEVPVEVSGTSSAIGDGATVETTAATTAGLKAAGQTASFTSKVTPRMFDSVTKELGNPISATTRGPKL
jgi:hypothetical protein